MEISEKTLADIIQSGIELGTVTTLTKLGLLQPYISYKEAAGIYGRGTVDRWITEGLIEKIKDGENTSKVRQLWLSAAGLLPQSKTGLTM